MSGPLNWSVQLETGGASPDTLTDIVISADITLGLQQSNASATIVCTSPPYNIDVGQALYVYGQIGAGTPPILFNGLVQDIQIEGGGRTTILCTDHLARLKEDWNRDDRTYEDDDASAAIQNLVEASGIDVSLTSITAPAGWNVGTGEPLVLAKGDNPLSLVRQILEAYEDRWWIATYANGAVYAGPFAIGTAVGVYTYGSSPVLDCHIRTSLEGIYNAVHVEGKVYNDVPVVSDYAADSTYVPDPPKHRTLRISSPVIENPTRADLIAAARVITTPRTYGWAKMLLTPDLNPGLTAELNNGLTNVGLVVTSVRHHITETTAETEWEGEAP